MFTYSSLTYSHTFLVVGGISISSNDLLDPVRHGLHQFLQVRVLRIVHPENPQLLDLNLQLLQVCGMCLLQLHLHPRHFQGGSGQGCGMLAVDWD
jgi:hypothetical protein